jgi:hypothetical protein
MRRGSNFCPSEVVRWMYPQDWRHFMEDVRTSMMDLYRHGKIVVTQGGIPIRLDEKPKGPVRIQGILET